MSENSKDIWAFYPSHMEGPCLMLGRGFDFDACITAAIKDQLLIIQAPYPSKESDEEYPYPKMMELIVPISQIEFLLEKSKNTAKFKCRECEADALWYYMPSDGTQLKHERYFCDEHISRGCSCNRISFESGSEEEYTDDQGRLLPCCEYSFSPDGYYKINNEGD